MLPTKRDREEDQGAAASGVAAIGEGAQKAKDQLLHDMLACPPLQTSTDGVAAAPRPAGGPHAQSERQCRAVHRLSRMLVLNAQERQARQLRRDQRRLKMPGAVSLSESERVDRAQFARQVREGIAAAVGATSPRATAAAARGGAPAGAHSTSQAGEPGRGTASSIGGMVATTGAGTDVAGAAGAAAGACGGMRHDGRAVGRATAHIAVAYFILRQQSRRRLQSGSAPPQQLDGPMRGAPPPRPSPTAAVPPRSAQAQPPSTTQAQPPSTNVAAGAAGAAGGAGAAGAATGAGAAGGAGGAGGAVGAGGAGGSSAPPPVPTLAVTDGQADPHPTAAGPNPTASGGPAAPATDKVPDLLPLTDGVAPGAAGAQAGAAGTGASPPSALSTADAGLDAAPVAASTATATAASPHAATARGAEDS